MPDKSALGNRMKLYEGRETGRRLMPLNPVMARMDGVGFSRFTKKMKRPYDPELSRIMQEVTQFLVVTTNACIGYTQSDEISLVMHSDDPKSQIFNDGKIQKMVSKLSALTSTKFFQLCQDSPLKKHLKAHPPIFDARVWSVPNKEEAANSILWRELDATKNSISMAAHHYFGHKRLMHKHTGQQQEMLFSEAGVNWNDYPAFFKRGSFIQRRTVIRGLTDEELARIPEDRRPPPDHTFERSIYERIDMPPFIKVINRVGVIFDGEDPWVDGEVNN